MLIRASLLLATLLLASCDTTVGSVRMLVAELSQVFGDETATKRALATVSDPSADIGLRRRALHGLLTQKNPQVAALLPALLDEPKLRLDAIRGFAAVEFTKAPAILLRYRWKGDCQRGQKHDCYD